MKKIIALSSIAFLSTAVFAAADADAKIAKLEKKLAKLEKKVSGVNALAAKDNIKWDVDFRTAADGINYKTASGASYTNKSLLTNRLWLGMGYAPSEKILFRGQLAVNKAFGASYNQRGMGGFDNFDWVINETLTDETVRLREAYWLYKDKIAGLGVTASVGRRPATNGFLGNLREDDKSPKSPMAHVINMEFDGASASVSSDDLLPGMMFKLCVGRGLTNAASWNSVATKYATQGMMGSDTLNYIEDDSKLKTSDMYGFIFRPYDDGQYSLMTTWYKGLNVPGMFMTYMDGLDPTATVMEMKSAGDMTGAAASLKVDGIGDGISDFLDETTLFASYATTKSTPSDITRTFVNAGPQTGTWTMPSMIGDGESKTGHSYWVGAQIPNFIGGKFGLEYNHGSKYWKPFTYGEDTMIGSKIAARGNAIEAYWTQPLIDDVFSMQLRYTKIDYDFTGSDGFFGDGGAAMTMAEAQAKGMDPVKSAQNARVYFRYRY